MLLPILQHFNTNPAGNFAAAIIDLPISDLNPYGYKTVMVTIEDTDKFYSRVCIEIGNNVLEALGY
jgi:hypothetical protein